MVLDRELVASRLKPPKVLLSKIRKKVNRLLRKRIEKNKKKLIKSLESSENPLLRLALYLEKSSGNVSIAWEALLQLYENRHPNFDVVINNYNEVCCVELCHLLTLKKHLISSRPLSEADLEAFIDFYRDGECVVNKKSYKNMLVAIIIKNVAAKDIPCKLWKVAGDASSVGDNQALKVIKKASQEKAYEVFYLFKEEFYPKMNEAAKVKVFYWELLLKKKPIITYIDVEKRFCDLDSAIAREYKQHLLPLYRKIPVEKNYLDASIVNKKLDYIKQWILSSVSQQEKLSFVRLNDGEGYGFPDETIGAFDHERQELHWWGGELDVELREKIQRDFITSLQHHDLVGIPSVFRFVDEINVNRDPSITNNALLQRLFSACQGFLSNYQHHMVVLEGQSNLYLFDEKFIHSIISEAKKVYFVSGVDAKTLSSIFGDGEKIGYIEIPTHRLLRGEKFASKTEGLALPHVYEAYLGEIAGLSKPGVVFFISAGFIGKIFSAEAAKNGAVCLDIGQYLMHLAAKKVS